MFVKTPKLRKCFKGDLFRGNNRNTHIFNREYVDNVRPKNDVFKYAIIATKSKKIEFHLVSVQ